MSGVLELATTTAAGAWGFPILIPCLEHFFLDDLDDMDDMEDDDAIE